MRKTSTLILIGTTNFILIALTRFLLDLAEAGLAEMRTCALA
ncbi:MAG TPA: hypothetical protein VED37_08135 [Ktedonobacteraceae bacterium]|nr:hypothetical protein [Ktedonobacteraceae bacterium]